MAPSPVRGVESSLLLTILFGRCEVGMLCFGIMPARPSQLFDPLASFSARGDMNTASNALPPAKQMTLREILPDFSSDQSSLQVLGVK
jgi:hypothetical protein